ncbi:MAG TPA: tetratricopeptide repeat protein, partial [Steroidobacteraceae bacterium]|nr:tetratricopeptide repeat protein [Steroidobacteraceae bacterium]
MQAAGAPRVLFNEAISLIEAGRLADAESRCLAALEMHPDDINMRALLGALLVKQDRRVEAEATLRKVVESAPEFAKPAEDL